MSYTSTHYSTAEARITVTDLLFTGNSDIEIKTALFAAITATSDSAPEPLIRANETIAHIQNNHPDIVKRIAACLEGKYPGLHQPMAFLAVGLFEYYSTHANPQAIYRGM